MIKPPRKGGFFYGDELSRGPIDRDLAGALGTLASRQTRGFTSRLDNPSPGSRLPWRCMRYRDCTAGFPCEPCRVFRLQESSCAAHQASTPAANRLLAALTHNDRQRLLADCEPVELAFAEVLARPCEQVVPARIMRAVHESSSRWLSQQRTDAAGGLPVGQHTHNPCRRTADPAHCSTSGYVRQQTDTAGACL